MAAASAQDAVAALRSLLRVAPADLAAAAAQRAQQGALPCETQKRVEQLAQQLAHAAATRAFVVASSDSDSDSDSEDEGARHGRLQATYRWPPVAGPPAAPLAAGGQQEGAAGQGLFMPTKDYSAEELDTFLQGQYLGADTEGMLEQVRGLGAGLGRQQDMGTCALREPLPPASPAGTRDPGHAMLTHLFAYAGSSAGGAPRVGSPHNGVCPPHAWCPVWPGWWDLGVGWGNRVGGPGLGSPPWRPVCASCACSSSRSARCGRRRCPSELQCRPAVFQRTCG